MRKSNLDFETILHNSSLPTTGVHVTYPRKRTHVSKKLKAKLAKK